MELLESFKMATSALVANRLRSTLTMLGIIIGNASVIAMIGVGEAAQNFVTDQLEGLGPNVLFVVPGNQQTQRIQFEQPRTLVLEDAQAIVEQISFVRDTAPERNSRELVTYRNRNTNLNIIGTTPGFTTVRNFEMERGRFLRELDIRRNNRVAVLGKDLIDRIFEGRNPIGEQIRVKNIGFEVIGILEPKGSSLGVNYDEAVIIPITTMTNRIVGRTSPYGLELTYLALSIRNEDLMRAAEFQITNLLRQRHNITGEDDFVVRSQKDLMEIADTVTGALTILLAAIASISLLVGGIGIMNIMLVSVSERTQEIGLRKAIGASHQDILTQFMIEAVILSCSGGAIGTLLGIGSMAIVSVVTPLHASVSLFSIGLAVGVSGGIGLFFGVIPARQAARLDPIVALRSA